jgi:hypothetical protein
MAISVTHSPSAAAVGGVARQAGLGQYSKYMQDLIERQNSRKQQERMQQTGIDAQVARDANYQAFQQQTSDTNFKQKLAMAGVGQELKKDMFNYQTEVRGGIDQTGAMNEWQGYVSSIKNFKDWSPQQQNDFQGVQKDIQAIMQNKGLRNHEKAGAIRQGIQRLQSIQESIVPKQKTQQDEWAEQGKGVGDSWINTQTGDTETRDNSGNIKVTHKATTPMEFSKAVTDMTKALTAEGVPPSNEEVMKRLDEAGIRLYKSPAQKFLEQVPNVAERIGLTADEVSKAKPEQKEQWKKFEELEKGKLEDDEAKKPKFTLKEKVSGKNLQKMLFDDFPNLAKKTKMTAVELGEMTDVELKKLYEVEEQLKAKSLKKANSKY